MNRVRLGAVGYLNARPLVCGLDLSPQFSLRFDVPSRCATLLHEGAIDVGLIPSVEYLRGPTGYHIVPDLAIASRGPVASVALYVRKPIADVRSIAMDTSSRTSVALVSILCERVFRIRPAIEAERPDLQRMLTRCDGALLIGDNALFQGPVTVSNRQSAVDSPLVTVNLSIEKIDLGGIWTTMTGLPFVYAFWAGRADALTTADVRALQEARDSGVARPDQLARVYFPEQPERQAVAAAYLRDNIRYHLGPDERAGLELFYRYAAESGLIASAGGLRFF